MGLRSPRYRVERPERGNHHEIRKYEGPAANPCAPETTAQIGPRKCRLEWRAAPAAIGKSRWLRASALSSASYVPATNSRSICPTRATGPPKPIDPRRRSCSRSSIKRPCGVFVIASATIVLPLTSIRAFSRQSPLMTASCAFRLAMNGTKRTGRRKSPCRAPAFRGH